jgi:calcineurin-like phosphoesterase family protein
MAAITAHGLRSAAALAASLAVACGDEERDVGAPAAPARGDAAVLLAAGDIAECGSDGDEATAEILDDHPDATIATLGDNAYQQGKAKEFRRCYGPSWGRHRGRTYPATGNHDYGTKKARGHDEYFGTRDGPSGRFYYSYDLGWWHVVVLNSDCWRIGGCGRDDPQAKWMRQDLRDHPTRCALAYWHRPPFSSGRYGDPAATERVRPLWALAVQEGVDVVLTGHEHSYERFAPMDASGAPDAHGTRLLVVGTGGGNLREYTRPPLATTQVRNGDTWGVLRLNLRRDGYDWKFLAVAGRSFTDAGRARCR